MKLKVIVGTEDPASASPQRPLLLSVFTVFLTLLTAAAALGFFAIDGLEIRTDQLPFVALLVLTVLGTHSEEVFGDSTAINGSILVILAGAGVAYAGGPLWIAGACGLVAGLHWHHVRDRAVRKLLVNTSFTTLSALAATALGRVLAAEKPGVVAVAVCGAATVMAYWLTDNFLVAVVLTIVDGRSFRAHARELVRSETDVIPFAFLGFVGGYEAVVAGPWFGALGIASLLLLAELVLFRRGRRGSIRWLAQWIPRIAPIAALWLFLGTLDLGASREAGVLPVFAVLGFVGVVVLDRVRVSLALFALVAFEVGAAAALPRSSSFGVVLVVGIAACLGLAVRTRQVRNRFVIVSAGAVVALAVGGLISGVGSATSSVGGSLALGLLAGLTALLAWHLVIGVTLLLDVGRSMLPTVGSMIRADSGLILAGGLCGIGLGWIGDRVGVLGVLSLGVAFGLVSVLLALSARRKGGRGDFELPDGELLDVVRSALLDIPASRLPD